MAKKNKTGTAVPETKYYTTLEREASAEITERKSIFMGRASPVRTADEAIRFIEKIRAEHRDASHTAYAYLLSEPNAVRCSDDGEPQGTAGIPILDVIRKGGFCDAVITVTRYFGGILLGTGGLIRAYSTAASLAAAEARVTRYESYTECRIRCGYSDYRKLEYELPKMGIKCDHIDFKEEVELCLAVKDEIYEFFLIKMSEITSGRIVISVTGKRFDK
jgi:uncharacterized YigZ family protein